MRFQRGLIGIDFHDDISLRIGLGLEDAIELIAGLVGLHLCGQIAEHRFEIPILAFGDLEGRDNADSHVFTPGFCFSRARLVGWARMRNAGLTQREPETSSAS